MGKGFGYAKAILFGEHFVVYGIPAIGIGLPRKTEIELSRAPQMKIEAAHVDAHLLNGIEAIKKAMNIADNFNVRIRSEIDLGSGLGSSAAVSVAFIRALSDEYKLNLSSEQVSAYAYEAEKIYHGTPSGIDNTLAAFGGAFVFEKKPEAVSKRPLKIGKPMHLVVGSTGKKRKSTADIVAEVRARKERHPAVFSDLFSAESKIIEAAIPAIEHGKLEEVGELMNLNHGLLCALGVSAKENEAIVQAARDSGALGAKITGAGMGGSCIILTKHEKNAEEIANEIRKGGYAAFSSVVQ